MMTMPFGYARSMELRHLRYFLAIVEEGGVTAAATRLRVAQPAVSRQLQRLEHDLGVVLFARNGPRLTLTNAGRQMLDVAADIVARADDAVMIAQQMASGRLNRIAVAAAPTTIEYVLSPFVATLKPADPLVSVHSVVPDRVHDAVVGGHDLGVAATPAPAGRLAWRTIADIPLRAYVAAHHPWARKRTIGLRELVREPLVLQPQGDPARRVFDAAVTRAATRYDTYEEIEWPILGQALAAADRGIAIVSGLERFGAHSLYILDEERRPVLMPLHACWNPDHYAAAALAQFADQLATFTASVVVPVVEGI